MEPETSNTPGNPQISWSDLPDQELTTLVDLVRRTIQTKSPGLGFPPALERIFELETDHDRVRHMIVAGIVAILTYNIFLFSDYFSVPALFSTAVGIRFGIVTPLAIIIMLLQYRGLPPLLREASGAAATVIGGLSLIYLLILSGNPNEATYIYGLILVIMYGNIVLQLRFWHALAASLVILLAYLAVTLLPFSSLTMIRINNSAVLFATSLLTLFATYSLERDQRRSYLLNLGERLRQATLSLRNRELMELSHIDPLTGLANRRELDDYLDIILRRPETDQIALAIFDVDHFKAYNDVYGHPRGDECLRQIAGVLAESSRRGADLVVRFGGEEFMAVLPGCDLSAADGYARRILKAVHDLSIPHEASPTSEVVSISAGIAVGWVTNRDDVKRLIGEADAALYRAKSGGRNRVHQ